MTVHVFDTVTSDDHNSPCVLAPSDAPPIIMWSLHNATGSVYMRKGTVAKDFTTLAATVTITFGTETSYAQLIRVSGNDLICFARHGANNDRWGFIRSSNYGTSWGAMVNLFIFPSASVAYMATARVGNVLRCALWQFGTGDIHYVEINLVTGAITRDDGTGLANLDGTGLPYTLTASERIHDTTSGGARLHDVGAGSDPEIAMSTWTTDGDTAYKYLRRSGGIWTPKAMVAAGVGISVGSDHYQGGMTFPTPTAGGVVFLARESAGTWYVEKHVTADEGDTWTVTVIATSSSPLVRPFCPINRSTGPEVLWHKVPRYTSYTDWAATLHAA